jgi:hypothetical protein
MMHTILILEAIPHGLRLDKEVRNIRESIERGSRDKFILERRSAIRPKDIRRALADTKPSIVHFCGHGDEHGNLIIEDDGGSKKLLKPAGLAGLFKLYSEHIQCVIVNTCFSEKIAESLSQHISYAVGMNHEITDESAIAFSEGFYDTLGYKLDESQSVFERAFDEGIAAISLEDDEKNIIPVLKKNCLYR